jgi:uncharacterized protein (UPF0335 family)
MTEEFTGDNKIGGIAADALAQYVDRIERLTDEKAALSEDIKAVYAESKSTGFDVKILRKAVARRRMDKAEREEQDELLALYEAALLQSLLG